LALLAGKQEGIQPVENLLQQFPEVLPWEPEHLAKML